MLRLMVHFVDLFCGIGGASTGARDAGAKVRLAVDLDPDALRVHAQNHPDCVHLHGPLPEIEARVVAALPLALGTFTQAPLPSLFASKPRVRLGDAGLRAQPRRVGNSLLHRTWRHVEP